MALPLIPIAAGMIARSGAKKLAKKLVNKSLKKSEKFRGTMKKVAPLYYKIPK